MLKKVSSEAELNYIRDLYEASFPESEKKPLALILEKQEQGLAEILMITDPEGEALGLAMMAICGDLALLDYLAVDPKCRGTGVGGGVLAALQERYGRDRIVVEIERTTGEGAQAENIEDRIRRKNFYLRNGMVPAEFYVDLMGVEMEVLTFGRKLGFEEYHSIYRKVFPGKIANEIRLV